mgnify:CR=1 FL=1
MTIQETHELYLRAGAVTTSVEFWEVLALLATHQQKPCAYCGAAHRMDWTNYDLLRNRL